MDENDGRGEILVVQVRVKAFHLRREEETLVNNRARGEGADVAVFKTLLDPSAQDEEIALDIVAVRVGGGRIHEELADAGPRRARRLADGVVLNRHVAPRERLKALAFRLALEDILLALGAKDHGDGVATFGRQVFNPLSEEVIRDLHEQPRAVARLGVVARRAAMLKTHEDIQSLKDEIVRGAVVHLRQQSDAARIVLEVRVVKAGVHLLFHNVPLC